MMSELPGIASRLARYRDTRLLQPSAFPSAFVQLSGRLDLRAEDDGVAHLLRIPRNHAASHWHAAPRPPVEPLSLLIVLGQRALQAARCLAQFAGRLAQRGRAHRVGRRCAAPDRTGPGGSRPSWPGR